MDLTSDHVFDRLFVWLEFGLHSLHSVCFLCSFFDVPGDFLRGPYHHALKVELLHETFSRSDKMICIYTQSGFAGLKQTCYNTTRSSRCEPIRVEESTRSLDPSCKIIISGPKVLHGTLIILNAMPFAKEFRC